MIKNIEQQECIAAQEEHFQLQYTKVNVQAIMRGYQETSHNTGSQQSQPSPPSSNNTAIQSHKLQQISYLKQKLAKLQKNHMQMQNKYSMLVTILQNKLIQKSKQIEQIKQNMEDIQCEFMEIEKDTNTVEKFLSIYTPQPPDIYRWSVKSEDKFNFNKCMDDYFNQYEVVNQNRLTQDKNSTYFQPYANCNYDDLLYSHNQSNKINSSKNINNKINILKNNNTSTNTNILNTNTNNNSINTSNNNTINNVNSHHNVNNNMNNMMGSTNTKGSTTKNSTKTSANIKKVKSAQKLQLTKNNVLPVNSKKCFNKKQLGVTITANAKPYTSKNEQKYPHPHPLLSKDKHNTININSNSIQNINKLKSISKNKIKSSSNTNSNAGNTSIGNTSMANTSLANTSMANTNYMDNNSRDIYRTSTNSQQLRTSWLKDLTQMNKQLKVKFDNANCNNVYAETDMDNYYDSEYTQRYSAKLMQQRFSEK